MRGHERTPAEYRRDLLGCIVPLAGGCWEWAGVRSKLGYGRFTYGRKAHQAHRLVYELFVGPIPDGLELDHLCWNPWCVFPEHLEPVTHAENTRRRRAERLGHWASRTHCRNGHELTPENSAYYTKQGYSCRYCRTCRINTKRRMRARQRNAK
jgi:HNH endonuclease